MRRLWILFLAAAIAVPANVFARRQFYVIDDWAITTSSSNKQFTDNGSGGSSAAFRARDVIVVSDASSPNTCFFDLKDTTAGTGDIPIAPGGVWNIPYEDGPGETPGVGGFSDISAICETGTATFTVVASR